MSERIRWNYVSDATGYAGTLGPFAFRIFRMYAGPKWMLTADLPGMGHTHAESDDPDFLKAEAERWLAGFVSSLGAIFPRPAQIEQRPGKRQLTDTDILDAFRTVTNWSDAEVLHYESCSECAPDASVVCDDFPMATEPADDETAKETGQ